MTDHEPQDLRGATQIPLKAAHNPRQVHTLAQLARAAKRRETLWCPGRWWSMRSARVLMWFPGWALLRMFKRGMFLAENKSKTKGETE